MDGVGQHSTCNPQESGDSLDQTSSSLSFMPQGHDLSNRISTTPQNIVPSQRTNSVSVVVTPASGITTGTANNTTITHRIHDELHFNVTVSGLPLEGSFIRVPLTRSVKRCVPAMGLCQYLNLTFVLRGAQTGKIHEFACQSCKNKISRDLASLSRVDFTEKQDLIALEDGKARVSFRFTCYPNHGDDGCGVSADEEYIIRAVLKDELQVDTALYEIPNRFKIVRYANSPAEDLGQYRGPEYSPLSQGGAIQAGGSLGSTAFVPVTPPLDANPLILRSFPHHGIPSSHTVPLRPSNVAENPAPLPSYPVLHDPYGHIRDYAPESTSVDVGLTGTHRSGAVGLPGMPRYSTSVEVRSADIVVQREPGPFGVLENESRAKEDLSQHYPHDLQVSPGNCSTLPLGTSSFTRQRPFHVPKPTPFMGVVSNKLIGNGGGISHGVVGSSEETLQTISPSQLYGRMDWSHPHQPGTALAPTHYAGMTFSTRPSIPTMACAAFAATIPPSIAWSPNGSDHGIMPPNSQQGTTQELNPCAEYVAPSMGPMTGGVEVTIVGTNFPHTLPLSVYFSEKPALITRKTRETIRCLVPAASSPGPVDLWIVVEPPGSVPVIDCRMAKFTYEDKRMTGLMVHVKYVTSQRNPALCEETPTSTRRAVQASVQQASEDLEPDINKDLQSLDQVQFEEIAIQILNSCSMHRNWRNAVSCPNELGQTLAHLAVALGYIRLLAQLVSWKIDLSVRDTTGATALHFACLFDHPDCVALLIRNAADQQIYDISFKGTLNQSSDLASGHAGCVTDTGDTLRAERNLVPKGLKEENKFDSRRANLLECGADSVEWANTDLNPGSPATYPTETGTIGVSPPGATSPQSIGMVRDAWSNIRPPNRQYNTSLGNDAHPETSYSHINTTKGTLRTFSDPVLGTSMPSGALWLQNETPTSAQIEGSGRSTNEAFLKEVVPTKGGGISHQTATLPVADMSTPFDEWYTFQEFGNLEARTTIYSAEFTPQGSSPRILPIETPSTGTPNPASPLSPSTPILVTSPTLPVAVTPLAGASTEEPFGNSLQPLLGTNQSNSPDAHDPHPTDLIHGGLVVPKLPPPEPYEFREMTLGCRFVATDQWLTTRVDTTWTISQVKLHMLTKLLGARRDQLKALNHHGESPSGTTHSAVIHENRIIATSNRSPVVFGLQESSDLHSLSYSPNPPDQPSPRLVDRKRFSADPDIPSLSSFIHTAPTLYQTQFDPSADTINGLNTDLHFPYLGFVAAAPPTTQDLNENKLNKEDVLDELLDRLETDAKERVHKVAGKYCLIRFLYGNMLDDNMTLTEYRLRPFELLEMQETSRFLQIPRRVYLDVYWESPAEIHARDKEELHGVDGDKKRVRMEREVKVQQELQRDFVAEFMSNPVDEAREEPRSAAALMLLSWKNTPEARARENEKRRRKLLQRAEQEEKRRQQREIEEGAMERWVERLVIIEGHHLNVWKNRGDDSPEQSWDLRRVVEVSGPKNQPEFPPGSVAAAYAALKNSNALNVIRVDAKQKCDMEEEAKASRPHLELHIRFSIPLSSVNEELNPTGPAAKFKREFKKMIKPSTFSISASNSPDPFNQGVGTSTTLGSGSATLVLRLPDERSLESLSRIVHRSVGRYPLNPKRKRAQEVTHADIVDATTGRTTKQESRFHPYPEWRERMLQKCIASGRYGILAPPARHAKSRPDTGVYELPRELQQLWENEEVASQPESMMSDAEWEGWRRELESIQPEPSFVTESYGLLRHRKRADTPVPGRGNALEEIIKRATEHLGQPSRALMSSPVSLPASCGTKPSPPARRPVPPSNSAPTSPRQSFSVANCARPATLDTSTASPRPSSCYTHDANSDLATLFPNPPDAPEDGRLPGLGGGLGSYQPHTHYQPYTHTVTTISVLRGADNEAAPKKGMARAWSNKGQRRGSTEDNLTSEGAVVEKPLLKDDDTWARSHNEGLDRLRHMSSSTGSKGGLLKSFSLRDR